MASEISLLRSGLQSLQVTGSDTQLQQLVSYLDLMERWNRAYNLTAIKNRQEWLSKHILDSLAILPWLDGHRLIDVGTGAGLPGIPLAIMLPNCQLSLLDSNGKKTRFLFQVKTQLGLSNVDIIESRVETYQPPVRYDCVVSRAFASLADMVVNCEHLLSLNGKYFAMKSALVTAEVTQMQVQYADRYAVKHIHSLDVPGVDGTRALVECQPTRVACV